MSIAEPANANVLWFLPTHGDGRHLGTTSARVQSVFSICARSPQAADDLGYFGVLLPTGRSCEDSWVIASALAPFTERLRYLVAVRPGLQSPTVAARMTATLDRVSQGRLLINVVTGGDPVENNGDGIFLDHDERYEVTREFLERLQRTARRRRPSTFEGKHIRIEDGRLLFPADAVAAAAALFRRLVRRRRSMSPLDTVDKYLTWGEPPAQVAEKIAPVAARREQTRARIVSFGIRLHVIVRETNAEAWAAADELITHVTDDTIASRAKDIRRGMDSVGQRRMMQLHRRPPRQARDQSQPLGRRRPGARRRRDGAGRRSRDGGGAHARNIRTLGIDTFIVSGYPHLEEAYRFAELVFPLLLAGASAAPRAAAVQYGAVRRDHRQRQPPRRQAAAHRNHERRSKLLRERATDSRKSFDGLNHVDRAAAASCSAGRRCQLSAGLMPAACAAGADRRDRWRDGS